MTKTFVLFTALGADAKQSVFQWRPICSAILSVLMIVTVSQASATSNDLEKWKSLNEACRGNSERLASTEQACKARDNYERELPQRGYCFHAGESDADSFWEKGLANGNGICKL